MSQQLSGSPPSYPAGCLNSGRAGRGIHGTSQMQVPPTISTYHSTMEPLICHDHRHRAAVALASRCLSCDQLWERRVGNERESHKQELDKSQMCIQWGWHGWGSPIKQAQEGLWMNDAGGMGEGKGKRKAFSRAPGPGYPGSPGAGCPGPPGASCAASLGWCRLAG